MRRGGRNRLMLWTGSAIPYKPGKNDLLEATRRVGAVIGKGGVVAIAGEGRIGAIEGRIVEITDDSGGRTELVRDARDLDPATASIADELSKQYYIGYPSPGHRDGRWRTIRLEVRDRTLKVRARRGYVATP